MENQTTELKAEVAETSNPVPKRFNIYSEIIGVAEVLNAGLLVLTASTIVLKYEWVALAVLAGYAMSKNFVERCKPKNPY